jgi:large subunit ribosomal protein L32
MSSSKSKMRRAQHDRVGAPNLVPCANCSAPCLPHRICGACGHYKGKAVLVTAADDGADEDTETA